MYSQRYGAESGDIKHALLSCSVNTVQRTASTDCSAEKSDMVILSPFVDTHVLSIGFRVLVADTHVLSKGTEHRVS